MKNKHLPYRVYTIPVLLLASVGLLASLYLALSHYRNYTDIDYSSFCAISKAINCDTVSQSTWSILFGIPLAIWGAFAYALFFIIALPAQIKEHRYLWDLLFILALVYSLADIYFGYITVTKIHAYCIMCLLTYAASLALLFSIWIIRRRFNTHSFKKGILDSFSFLIHHKFSSFSLILLFFLLVSLKLFFPSYWMYEYPPWSKEIHTGITEDGRPWIGAEHPTLIIKEFTDYQCFQCSKMHNILRHLIHEHPETIQLVHYNYPMDENYNTALVKKPFHTGSGDLALLAIASGKQGKYWVTNDALYSIARQGIKEFNINKFSRKIGLDAQQLKQDMYSKPVIKKLENDIKTGLRNKIIGTPTFIINKHVYPGHFPPEILRDIAK